MVNRLLRSGYFKKYNVSIITKVYVDDSIFTSRSQINFQKFCPNSYIIKMYEWLQPVILFITTRIINFLLSINKEIMKYKSIQISPSKIEIFFQSHTDVPEVVVVDIPYILEDEHPIAFVTKVPRSKVYKRKFKKLISKNSDFNHL
ncbi:hypothetical protein HZH68_013020 [Vespula germanica]|uniref:Uncharacterized protein n=1 Tax=Vespula germanica TaxID=30212 RepID=A0A834JEW9_VESGE|nr:hypothetical protein HZH68_013020 [Vespula germanica]